MNGPAFSFKNVSKQFDDLYALKDITLHIPNNRIIGLLGANGSGKTTLMKCLLNFYNDYTGEIKIYGFDNKEISQKEKLLSYIPDTPVFYEELSVKEHLEFISSMYNTGEKVKEYIDLFDLRKHLHKFPQELSKGNRQKLAICCAILREFKLFVADEPFSGLDPKQLYKLKQLIKNLRDDGKTILISTHLLKLVEDLCDYYIILDEGKLIAEGEIQHIISKTKNSTDLEQIYFQLSEEGDTNASFFND